MLVFPKTIVYAFELNPNTTLLGFYNTFSNLLVRSRVTERIVFDANSKGMQTKCYVFDVTIAFSTFYKICFRVRVI